MTVFSTLFSNPFPNSKILDHSKLKAFADDKIDVSKRLISVWGRVENIVGNGENAGYWHFLVFPQCFEEPVLTEPYKPGIVWKMVKRCHWQRTKIVFVQ